MNILTFDIEEWFTYELYPKGGRGYYLPIIERYLEMILDILEETHTKATFFCLGVIPLSDPEVIRKIASRGHEIGCHSNKHILLNNMSAAEFKQDSHEAINNLEQLIGQKVEYYRAPAFSITENTKWALEILSEEGITCDSSIFPANRSFGGFPSFKESKPSIIQINGIQIKEFPISYSSIFGFRYMFSGGGYFRLFPYFVIKRLMQNSNYSMSYFHIRDLDKEQKRVYSLRYFQSYYGISSAFTNFKSYVNDFNFISIGEANHTINWDNAALVQL